MKGTVTVVRNGQLHLLGDWTALHKRFARAAYNDEIDRWEQLGAIGHDSI